MTDEEILDANAPIEPFAQLIWTAVVDVDDRVDLGASLNGSRFMVPIIGGNFYSGPEIEGLSGKVLSGGADRQVLRLDGVKELDALYEMQCENGDIITVRNRVIVDEERKPERYAMSVIQVAAPVGKFDWLNRRLLIGTLQSARPERQAVIVRAWQMDAGS